MLLMKLIDMTSQEMLEHVIRHHLPKKVSKAELILKEYFNKIDIKPLGDMSEFQIARLEGQAWNSEISVSNEKGIANTITYLIWD